MYLYHVTPFIDQPKRMKFTPRIPQSAGKSEDHTIPRICLADSIQLAIQASPEMIAVRNFGVPFRVYKFRIDSRNKHNIVSPNILFEKKLVPDALENHEYWCLKEIVMDSKLYVIDHIHIDFDLAWSVLTHKQILDITKLLLGDKIKVIKLPNNYTKLSSHELYDIIAHQLDELHYYKELDDLWDELAMLPWAAIKRIDELKIHEIKEIKHGNK